MKLENIGNKVEERTGTSLKCTVTEIMHMYTCDDHVTHVWSCDASCDHPQIHRSTQLTITVNSS